MRRMYKYCYVFKHCYQRRIVSFWNVILVLWIYRLFECYSKQSYRLHESVQGIVCSHSFRSKVFTKIQISPFTFGSLEPERTMCLFFEKRMYFKRYIWSVIGIWSIDMIYVFTKHYASINPDRKLPNSLTTVMRSREKRSGNH